MFGGAKGGAKTFLLCLWSYYWCKFLISFFGITEAQKYPLPVGFVGRKRSVDFSKTTLETWKKIIPSTSYQLREQDKEIIIEGRVKLFFGGLDDEELVNKFNSAELAFRAIDQAEETERGDVSVLGAALRLVYQGKKPPYKSLFTANPAECWLKEDFLINSKPKHYYIPALPKDNPHLPENYIKTLEENFGYDPALLKAYRDGDWNALQAENVLIKSTSLDNLKGVVHNFPRSRKIVASDPSQGGDECVIKALDNGRIIELKIMHENNTMVIAGEIELMMFKHKTNDCAIDTIGIGAGIADRLEELGKNVIRIESAEQADDKDRFVNRRAEMWWYVMEQITAREIPYPEDEELRRQLSAVKYRVVSSSGKIQLEPKEDTKKTLGRSPDRADCFVYGIWGLKQVTDENEVNTYSMLKRQKHIFAGAAGY